MPTTIQTVAGAAQFDGLTSATGRLTWDPSSDIQKYRPLLLSVSFFTTVVVTSMQLSLVEGVTATAVAVLARDTTGTRDSMDYPCRRVVMITATGAAYWRLEFVTVGKTVTGTVQFDWDYLPLGTI